MALRTGIRDEVARFCELFISCHPVLGKGNTNELMSNHPFHVSNIDARWVNDLQHQTLALFAGISSLKKIYMW